MRSIFFQGTAARQHQHRKKYLELQQEQDLARKAKETATGSASPFNAPLVLTAASLCCLGSRRGAGGGGGGNDDGGGYLYRGEIEEQEVKKIRDGAALEQLGNRRSKEAELTTAVI